MINADGELQASQRLAEAGLVMSSNPVTLQLRLLQTLAEIATEKNSTIVLPVPFGLFEAITQIANSTASGDGKPPRVRVGAAPGGDPADSMTPPERLEPGSHEGVVS